MKTRLRQVLSLLSSQPPEALRAVATPQVRDLSPRDLLTLLLHVAAELEHCLMVEYLFAAWSLGGSQVPAEHRDAVARWREVILGIAKEEMGHLITVQNALRLLGAPLNLGRQDPPWDSDFYPFPFMLEPLTLDALARFVYAEAPTRWSGHLADEVRKRAGADGAMPLHHVSELYDLVIAMVQDPGKTPDSWFKPETYPFQASWDEWGRGYQGGARGNALQGNPPETPDVLVLPMDSRDALVKALQAIATQGEAPKRSGDPAESSHFMRFRRIYEEMRGLEGWSPARPVAKNPYAPISPSGKALDPLPGCTPITDPEAQLWAHLFNIRYRLLMFGISHAFRVSGVDGPRGMIIHTSFAEMYNLRSIAQMLVTTPLGDGSDQVAGPPFQMPYTLELPPEPDEVWRAHLAILDASFDVARELRGVTSPERLPYLDGLERLDRVSQRQIQTILQGKR